MGIYGLPIVEGKIKGRGENPRKEMGYRVFPDFNRIGRPKAVSSIPHFARAL